MDFLLPTQQPALGQEHGGSRRGARHGSELPVRSQSLACQDSCAPPHERSHEHSHVLLPQRYGPVLVQVARGGALGHQPENGLVA